MVDRRLQRRWQPAQVEALDGRTLLSAGLVGGVWTVLGTERADVLSVDRSPDQANLLRAFRNGRLIGTVDATQVQEIRLEGRGGPDTLQINETHGAIGQRAMLLGGPGRNTLIGGSGPTVLDGGPGGQSLLQPGTGTTTFRQGLAADTVRRFGSGQAFRQFLSQAARRLGTGVGPVLRAPGGALQPVAAPVFDSAQMTAPGHSQTNVQVAGVDEADIIETDGQYLYLLSRQQLVIADVRQTDAPVVASRTSLEGWPLAEYLDGKRLTVLTAVSEPSTPTRLAAGAMPALVARFGGRVQASTYDITDPTRPKLVLQTSIDGQYADSRYVDGKLYLVLQNDLLAGYWGSPVALGSARTGNLAARLMRAADASVLPTFSSSTFGAEGQRLSTRGGVLVRPSEIYRPVVGDEANLISVVVLDARGTSAGPVGTAAVLGSYASTLHVTKDTLDIFSPRWDAAGGDTTSISRFALGGENPTLVATGTVPGSLINSYAADARGDDLRVATTTWRDGRPSSGLYVLRAQAGRLNTIGKVQGLAPGESLFAARFEADRAYLITFEQVDPLWAIDLTDASAPRVVGELKVPGFSRFLQPVADGYLLGIGRDVDPSTQRTTDLQLSLFDVRDLSRPSLVSTYNIAPSGDGWIWSDAEWDPHAVGWFPELGVVAVPVQGGSFTIDSRYVPQSRLELVRINTTAAGAKALTGLGAVEHDSGVLRSVRIADAVYSIADLDLRSVRVLENRIDPLGRLVIQAAPPDDGPVVGF